MIYRVANHVVRMYDNRFFLDESTINVTKLRWSFEKSHQSKLLGSLSCTNKLINICGNQIKLVIAFQVKEARKFSLEVDSCQDVGVIDQVSICVRYVRNGMVNERLLCMTPIRTTTGRQYFELVKTELIK